MAHSDIDPVDISLLFAAQQLEPLMECEDRTPLLARSESGWTMKNDPETDDAGKDYVSHLFNEFNLDGNRIHNAMVKVGYDTQAKKDIRMFLSDLATMGIGTNLTCLETKGDEFYDAPGKRDWKKLAEFRHIPETFEQVVHSSFHFSRLLAEQRSRDKRDIEHNKKWPRIARKFRPSGIRMALVDFWKLLQKQYEKTYQCFDTGSRRRGNLHKQNILNFEPFFTVLLPEWLTAEIKKRIEQQLEFNLLDAIAIKPEPDDQVLLTSDPRRDFHAKTVLESY